MTGLAPNACGLYDMSGNVWEWTQDWYDDYPSGSETDPMGAESSFSHVVRGGDWGLDASYATVSARGLVSPVYAKFNVGFRLARSIP